MGWLSSRRPALQTVQNEASIQWLESNPANAEVRADFRFGKFPPKHSADDEPVPPVPPLVTASAPVKPRNDFCRR